MLFYVIHLILHRY